MEKKKNRRRKLFIPLFLSTILMITTTYAWFSANRMVSIESLNVHVQADGGIEVSTNAIDWKQVVTVQDIMDARTKYGGSDYHGKPKPDIEIGVGTGNLNISKDILEEWINKDKLNKDC